MFTSWLLATLVLQVWVHLAFILASLKRNNTIADVFWGLGFIIFTSTALALQLLNYGLASISAAGWVTWILVLVWGLRLTGHITNRGATKKEDWRYKKWRQEWGSNWWWRSYLQVFLLQSVFLLLIAFAPWWAIVNPGFDSNLGLLWLGIAVWLFGFEWEAIADAQLQMFKNNPQNKGQILQSGLWRYSRHPNYFGEATLWWGVWLVVLSSNWPLTSWLGWLSVVSPLTITILVRFVSGVPLLEKKYAGRPEFEKYKEKTPIFIPWWPKKG